MCFKQEGAITTLSGKTLKLVDKFIYLSNNISSTEMMSTCSTIFRLLMIWKSDLTDKIKWDFFQAAAASLLLFGC